MNEGANKTVREIKLFHFPDATAEEWHVEDIDCDGDGIGQFVLAE
jgi:hypothetical protein